MLFRRPGEHPRGFTESRQHCGGLGVALRSWSYFKLGLLVDDGSIGLVQKPAYEDREIVTTPQPLVEEVIQRAFDARFSAAPATTFEELCQVRVLDVAIGSGRFLVHALDKLVDTAIGVLMGTPNDPRLYKVSGNEVRLRFEAKRQLLQQCLYGIDVDFNAVEVARHCESHRQKVLVDLP